MKNIIMLIILACLTTPMTDTRQITKEFAERHKWTREKDAQYIRAIVDIMMTQHHGEWTPRENDGWLTAVWEAMLACQLDAQVVVKEIYSEEAEDYILIADKVYVHSLEHWVIDPLTTITSETYEGKQRTKRPIIFSWYDYYGDDYVDEEIMHLNSA